MKPSTQPLSKPLTAVIIDTGHQCEVIKNVLTQTNFVRILRCWSCISDLNTAQLDEDVSIVIVNALEPIPDHLEKLGQLNSLSVKPIVIAITKFDYQQYISPLMNYNIHRCISAEKIPTIGSLVFDLSDITTYKIPSFVLNIDDVKLINLICFETCNDHIAEKLYISIEALKKRKQRLSNKLQIQNNDKSFILWARNNGYF